MLLNPQTAGSPAAAAPTKPRFKVLVLCTGNSARSILAEVLFNQRGGDLFQAHSAGSHPTGQVNPFALALLQERGFNCSGLRSKSWDEFSGQGAPDFDFVMTVCGNADAQSCPIFSGMFQRIHWGLPDPAAVIADPEAARLAFTQCFETLEARINTLLALPLDQQTSSALAEHMRALSHQLPCNAG